MYYANRCVAKTSNGKRCKRTKATAEGTCLQHISMYPKRCMYVSTRFNRCTAVAPYIKDYCNEHEALREPIVVVDSDDEIITVHDSDSEYVPESDSETESEFADDEGSDSDDSEWLPYDHKKQKRPVIVEGGASESVCDCHDELNTAFYDWVEDEENPNVMLIRDTIVKTRDMSVEDFNELLDYLENIIEDNN
jgi:hypothetical protein